MHRRYSYQPDVPQRANLTKSTPLTLELFLEFKARKKAKREADALEKRTKKGAEGGRSGMSGREMFVFNPDLFVDDDSAMESDDLKIQEQQEVRYYARSLALEHLPTARTVLAGGLRAGSNGHLAAPCTCRWRRRRGLELEFKLDLCCQEVFVVGFRRGSICGQWCDCGRCTV